MQNRDSKTWSMMAYRVEMIQSVFLIKAWGSTASHLPAFLFSEALSSIQGEGLAASPTVYCPARQTLPLRLPRIPFLALRRHCLTKTSVTNALFRLIYDQSSEDKKGATDQTPQAQGRPAWWDLEHINLSNHRGWSEIKTLNQSESWWAVMSCAGIFPDKGQSSP